MRQITCIYLSLLTKNNNIIIIQHFYSACRVRGYRGAERKVYYHYFQFRFNWPTFPITPQSTLSQHQRRLPKEIEKNHWKFTQPLKILLADGISKATRYSLKLCGFLDFPGATGNSWKHCRFLEALKIPTGIGDPRSH